MPEGDTVWRTAHHLNLALAGKSVTEWSMQVPQLATSDLTSEVVHSVVARGKHILHRIGDFTLHSHLKMEGSWHIYPIGGRWQRPAYQARAVVGTSELVTVGFDLATLQLVETSNEDSLVGYLGPDLLGPDWDPDVAAAHLVADPERALAVALLDQRNLAGLGNVYANEICFLRGKLPESPIKESNVEAVVALAHRLITANRDRSERITTGDSRRGNRTWVYGRDQKPCRRCGTTIRRGELGANELALRVTYWCPRCQT